jgi:DNA-binding beta-propeller fold protein YncE
MLYMGADVAGQKTMMPIASPRLLAPSLVGLLALTTSCGTNNPAADTSDASTSDATSFDAIAAGDRGDGAPGADAAVAVDAAPAQDASSSSDASTGTARFPLVPVADVDLPGNATRFDYQDVDPARGHLVVAHMNDGEVLVVNLADGSVAKRLPGIPAARGIAVADNVRRIFVTSSPNHLVIIDAVSLHELSRVVTGNAPDGVGWDPVDQIVGVSDQADGAVSLIDRAGDGTRRPVALGVETGNVVFDPSRGLFWASVVNARPPDQLAAIDPAAARVTMRIDLPGCSGAHGLRLHPDGQSAFVACENNDLLARVDLDGAHAAVTQPTGAGPDVLSVDPGLGVVYVAAESGDLTAFDIGQAGLVRIDREHPGDNAHSVAVDAATHRVFFPLVRGPNGTPVLRIMRPSGT